MSLRLRRLSLAVVLLSVAALAIAGCGSDSDSGGGAEQIDVVATTTQIGDWVREVGGEAVDVHQILQPNTDPHDYEPRPSDVKAAAEAQLVFANGDELDHWVEEIVSESGGDAEVVDLGAVVPIRLAGEGEEGHGEEEHAEGEEEHAEEEHHHDSRYDPHWWHDPRNAEAAVREIERRLIAADPSAEAEIAANADAYLAQLRAMDSEIAACVDSVPADERKLVTDHDAFGYFADRYGIEVVGAVIPSQTTQAQPSAKELSELADTIEAENVRAVFPESSLSPSVAEAIADQTGASSDYTLYGDTLGPDDSDGATYIGMEEANADAVVRGFTGGERGCR